MDKLLKTVILMFFIMGLGLPLSYAYDIDPHYKFFGVKSPDSPYKNTWGAFQADLFSGGITNDLISVFLNMSLVYIVSE